ncbi:hypothetical protein HDV57DRAFT_322989 [Trichoderma longibrachiatum]|uniref:Uncharacterized protein n=1 Tax=Trichoderma longibrachiatum ATCC 18648 TaxID=983965 RepID=A0A2T4BW24_TRILO|nr:hypothetical protein M440DRAFT_1064295 [Trichoderma longibrachiatum ATCC 18648]
MMRGQRVQRALLCRPFFVQGTAGSLLKQTHPWGKADHHSARVHRGGRIVQAEKSNHPKAQSLTTHQVDLSHWRNGADPAEVWWY